MLLRSSYLSSLNQATSCNRCFLDRNDPLIWGLILSLKTHSNSKFECTALFIFNVFSLSCRLVCADISNGLEEIPVPASNVVDPIPSRPGKVHFSMLCSLMKCYIKHVEDTG